MLNRVVSFWRNLSISKKLFSIFGVMALLICVELGSLSFAMGALSSVRALVEGEGLWSKAQKDAVNSLQRYIITGDEHSYQQYLDFLQIPLGDHKARLELEKPVPDMSVIYAGFLQGQIHHDDIPGIVRLLNRFHQVNYIKTSVDAWRSGDETLSQLTRVADRIHSEMTNRQLAKTGQLSALSEVKQINDQLTALEIRFSSSLSAGSRWLEHLLFITLLALVLTVESSGLVFTFTFSRYLSRGLAALRNAAKRIGQGDFDQKVPILANDELGELGESINKMAEELKINIGRRKKAENFSEIKTNFLANMSHEIRTPLGAMLGFAQLLEDDSLSALERRKYLQIIQRAGGNLMALINDILDISKVESGRFTIEPIDFPLHETLHDLKRLLQIRCDEKGIQLQFQLDDNLPSFIHGDAGRLRQILLNLLSNAIKYTEKGTVKLIATLSNDFLFFDIQDTGIGIKESDQDLIFEIFHQAGDSNLTRKFSGSGLGLPLSRHLARMLGGDLFLKSSRIGIGSTFQAKIKFEPARESIIAPDLSSEKAGLSESRIDLKDLRLLVVDDNADNRYLLELVLQRWGCEPDFAVNGREAIDLVEKGSYDAVVMDVQMPVMNGIEAVEILRKKNYKLPVIALTARAMKEELSRCIAAGYSDFLTKPVETDRLINLLSRLAFDNSR